nr:ribosome maturation factor RimM [Desulforhopalus vacuolatus]
MLLGFIRKAQGIRGEVSMQCFSGQPENMKRYPKVSLISKAGVISGPLVIENARVQGKCAVLHFQGFATRNEAEEVRGSGIIIRKDLLPAASKDEYYLHQLVGKSVKLVSGKVIGTVHSFFNNGAHDLAVVRRESGEECYIPMVKGVIVQNSGEELVIDPPEGLLEANKAKGDAEEKGSE